MPGPSPSYVVVSEQFYNQTMHQQTQPLMGSPHKSFLFNLGQEQNYFPVKLPFTFPYFEEEVTYIIISSHGLIGMATLSTINDSSDPVMYKYVAPFKYNLKIGKDDTIHHGELGITGAVCYVVEWDNFKFYDDQLVSFKCALCSEGTIYFYYTHMTNYALLELEVWKIG